MARVTPCLLLIAFLGLIGQTTHAYDLTLGLLMPRTLKNIADFAIKHVNDQVFNGTSIKAKMRWQNGFSCEPPMIPIGITSGFHYKSDATNAPAHAYIGPVDNEDICSESCEAASYLSASFKKSMLSPACQDLKRNDDMNSVFVRTAYLPIDFSKRDTEQKKKKDEYINCKFPPKSVDHFNNLMDLMKWKYITVIVSTKYYQSAKYLEEFLSKCTSKEKRMDSWNKETTEKQIEIRKYNSTNFDDKKATDEFNKDVKEFLGNPKSRIFFLHGSDEDNARILVKARNNNMFNGTWGFITTEFNSGKVKKQWKDADWMVKNDGTRWKVEDVFSGFIDFSTPSVNMEQFQSDYKNSQTNGNNVEVTEKEAYLFDAIKLYALTFKKAMETTNDPKNISDIPLDTLMGNMASVNFTGASGKVMINKQKDRGFESYEIKYFTNGAIVKTCTEEAKYKILGDKAIKECVAFEWPGGQRPLDIPKCGFDGELCRKMRTLTIVFIIIAVILISLTIAAFVLYKRNKYGNNDLVSKGFVIDAEVILKMMNTKNETESNPSFEQNGKAGGSIGSRSPMLVEQGKDPKKSEAVEKISMKDNISIGSNADSLRERNVFKYKGQIVMVKKLQRSSVNISRDKDIKMEFKNVRDIHDQNLCAVIAVCLQSPQVSIIEQYCSKRSLMDVLQDESVDLDMMFKMSFASDISHGATELHRHGIIHGRLTSSNVVIDNRWVCKITDYGMHKFREEHYNTINQNEEIPENQKMRGSLWKAPELLQDTGKKPTKESDVYSFGIILSEIITREDPYGDMENMEIKDIIAQVKANKDPPFRPNVTEGETDSADLQLLIKEMRKCWDQNPSRRPNFETLRTTLKPKGSMMDNMVLRLEKYTSDLEERVAERNEELKGEKAKNDELLYKMLPMPVAIALQNGKEIPPTTFECVTIFFSDIVGFTAIAAESTPMQVVALLNDLYSCFDQCSDAYDCYKVETIGDAYMVVSGLPTTNGDLHAGEIATLSLDLLHHIKSFTIRHIPDVLLQLRIGIHSGPCVAGVVGLKMPRYCLFGDTVNYASRMESSGLALRVHVSPECKEILDKLGGYTLQDRGLVTMKGKGEIHTYFLTGREGFTKSLPDLSQAAGLDAHDFK